MALSVRNRVSRRDVVELSEELFGTRISTGAVDSILARASDALADPYEDLLQRVRSARALNVDETGWRTAGERRALWGAFSKRHALFRIAPDRHEDHAKSLLATPRRSSPPTAGGHTRTCRLPPQLCFSHLQRDFAATPKGSPPRGRSARWGWSCASASWAWEVFQHTGERGELKRTIRSLQRTYKPIIAATPRSELPTSAAAAWRATPEGLAGAVDLR